MKGKTYSAYLAYCTVSPQTPRPHRASAPLQQTHPRSTPTSSSPTGRHPHRVSSLLLPSSSLLPFSYLPLSLPLSLSPSLCRTGDASGDNDLCEKDSDVGGGETLCLKTRLAVLHPEASCFFMFWGARRAISLAQIREGIF